MYFLFCIISSFFFTFWISFFIIKYTVHYTLDTGLKYRHCITFKTKKPKTPGTTEGMDCHYLLYLCHRLIIHGKHDKKISLAPLCHLKNLKSFLDRLTYIFKNMQLNKERSFLHVIKLRWSWKIPSMGYLETTSFPPPSVHRTQLLSTNPVLIAFGTLSLDHSKMLNFHSGLP